MKEKIVFNAQGFHHLFYEPDGTARNIGEIIYKLTLFPLAIPVVKNATSIAEKRSAEVRKSRKKRAPLQKAKYYALVAKVGTKNPVAVRVILRKVGGGNLIFWSIMKN
ncbi:MAG: hypothetical protein HY007_02385 [Candidatus Sungbacteria bacterium]|nr:hypothetical protein [Candidatus Sungbacteria bacterium]